MDWIGEQLNIEIQEDWYKVKSTDILQKGGFSFVSKYYNGSLRQCLSSLYPEYTWHDWLFSHTPTDFWKSKANQVFDEIFLFRLTMQRKYFDWITEQLGITTQQELCNLSPETIKSLKGGFLLRGSLHKLLQTIYPEFQWTREKTVLFEHVLNTQLFQVSDVQLRKWFDSFAKKHGIEQQHDWYYAHDSVQQKHPELIGSLFHSLRRAFPEYEWNPSLFKKVFCPQLLFTNLLPVSRFT